MTEFVCAPYIPGGEIARFDWLLYYDNAETWQTFVRSFSPPICYIPGGMDTGDYYEYCDQFIKVAVSVTTIPGVTDKSSTSEDEWTIYKLTGIKTYLDEEFQVYVESAEDKLYLELKYLET